MIGFEEWGNKLFSNLSKGDTAVMLLFGVAGAIVVGVWNPLAAFTWQQSAALAAAGALGVKQSIQAASSNWLEQRKKKKFVHDERIRGYLTLRKLDPSAHGQAYARLAQSLLFFEEAIISTHELTEHIDEAVKALYAEPPTQLLKSLLEPIVETAQSNNIENFDDDAKEALRVPLNQIKRKE